MYAYTFIRKDIPLQHQFVQACHSALEAGSEFKKPGEIPNLILIELKDQKHLDETSQFLSENGIRFHKFFEPDNDLGFTSITTEPLCGNRKKALSNFKLWRAA